jgi:peroxiredoxin Q/BCP
VIKTGQRAPDFSAPATDGRTLRLSDLKGRHVVLYFFPKAFTTG